MSYQSCGVAATAKHYAVNNTEHERLESNSRISARAMREIYLKGFEIAIKEGDSWCIMSSYNLISELHAGHDLKMSTGDVSGVTAALDRGIISRDEVKICAARVLTMIMKTNAFLKTLE